MPRSVVSLLLLLMILAAISPTSGRPGGPDIEVEGGVLHGLGENVTVACLIPPGGSWEVVLIGLRGETIPLVSPSGGRPAAAPGAPVSDLSVSGPGSFSFRLLTAGLEPGEYLLSARVGDSAAFAKLVLDAISVEGNVTGDPTNLSLIIRTTSALRGSDLPANLTVRLNPGGRIINLTSVGEILVEIPPGIREVEVAAESGPLRGEGLIELPPNLAVIAGDRVYSPQDEVTLWVVWTGDGEPSALITDPAGVDHDVEVIRANETWWEVIFKPSPPVPLGEYLISASAGGMGASGTFLVDSLDVRLGVECGGTGCRVDVSARDGVDGSRVQGSAEVLVEGPGGGGLSLEGEIVNGTCSVEFSPWDVGDYEITVSVTSQGGVRGEASTVASIQLPGGGGLEISTDRPAYSPGEEVLITVSDGGNASGPPEVRLRTPGGGEISLEPMEVGGGTWECRLVLNSSVELGTYEVEATLPREGNASTSFLVDVLTLNVSTEHLPGGGTVIRASVWGFASGPLDGAEVSVEVEGPEASGGLLAETVGGEATVALPPLPEGEYRAEVRVSWMGLEASAEVEVGAGAPGLSLFIGDEVTLPPGGGTVEVGVSGTGGATNATLTFVLSSEAGEVVSSGSVPAAGTAEIDLSGLPPGGYLLNLTASWGNLTASKTVRVLVGGGACGSEIADLRLEVEGACASDLGPLKGPPGGPWAGWRIEEISLIGEPGFSANLSVPPGAALLDPESLIPVRASARAGGILSVEDGGVGDPGEEADGAICLALAIPPTPTPAAEAEAAGVPTPAPAPPRPAEVVRRLEAEAEGETDSWRVEVLDVREAGLLDPGAGWEGGRLISGGRAVPIRPGGVRINSTGTLFLERRIGPLGEPGPHVAIRPSGPGRILVKVGGKGEGRWIRVEVPLPPGAAVERVLAAGNNTTREVETWFQVGGELVVYDDPNQYYYVLYGVPPWWDPDGPDQGEDWHYRVPLKIPATAAHHTILARVDFGSLLSRLNVTGTFDNDSVRVVDPDGNLVPSQEYIPTGRSSGLVKFLLPKDLKDTSTFYVYFDIEENGKKGSLNTINSGADSGTLANWTWGRSPSGIASIVEASPPGPYSVDAGGSGGSPSSISDDGLPRFGSHSVVVGYRINGTEDDTTYGEDTWAAYDIRVPEDGGFLHFWYRVESWDSSYFDYLTVTLRNASDNSLLATVVSSYNPNSGYNYGYFSDSGWIPASFNLTDYAGKLIRVNFTVHTYLDYLYKTWAYVDNLTWANLTAPVAEEMVEGFGVNVTSPRGVETYGPLEVRAEVDAAPTSGILCRVYDPSGALRATAELYDDGTHGDPIAGDGEFTNSDVYDLTPGDPLGTWRVVVLANDSSSSLLGSGYDGLIHIPGRPAAVNYTDFFDVGEATFELRANVTGLVFEDAWPMATGYGAGDSPIGGARVGLFVDDGDGALDPYRDVLVDETSTSPSGRYSFLLEDRTYLVAVESKTLSSPRGLNPGRSWNETWAEETYQVGWDGASHSGAPKFGGADPTVSDACSLSVAFRGDFETWSGWSDYLAGVVEQSSEQAHGGDYSLKKDLNNDPNGGFKLIGSTVGRGYILQGYVYRPSGWSGGPIDRIGLENGSFDGYTFAVNHNTGMIWIDRRTGGSPTRISPRVSWDPPEDSWYFWRMIFFENDTIAFQVFDLAGHELAEVRATDSTYGEFDRVVVHGGWEYYVDDLMVWRPGGPCEHVTEVSAGHYLGESVDFGFSFDLIVNSLDSDHDAAEPRTAQGTLRQFLQNANAISGADRSWFVMAVPPNSGDSSGDWWVIRLNSTLGSLPQLADDRTALNGTVFWPDGTPRDANPGQVGSGWDVGVDGLHIPPFDRPEVEIDSWNSVALDVTGSGCEVSRLAVYRGTVRESGGGGLLVQDNLIGTMANGSDPLPTGAYYGVGIVGSVDGTVVRHNYVRVDNSGIRVEASSSQSASDILVEGNVVGSPSGGQTSTYDGILLIAYGGEISNVTVRRNLAEDQVGAGAEFLGRVKATVEENTFRRNGFSGGNPSPEDVGVVFFSNFQGWVVFRRNVVADSAGSGLTVKSPAANVTISENSFYNNSGLGIDLDASSTDPNSDGDGDGVTENDGVLNSSAADGGVDYPVISRAALGGDLLHVEGYLNVEGAGAGSSEFAGARIEIFLVNSSAGGDDLAGNYYAGTGELYGEGWLYLGNLTANASGDFSGWINVSGVTIEPGDLITATATLPGNGTSEFGPDVKVVALSLNLTVRKSVRPAAPCRYNVTLNVTNLAADPIQNAYVYDVIPQGMVMSGEDPPHAGSSGAVYWWIVDLGPAGSPAATDLINYTLESGACGSSDYNLSDATVVGLDPPGSRLNLSAREFVDMTLYPNGTVRVFRLWGILTISNPSGDAGYDVWIYLNSSGYEFYPDYPVPSNSSASPPLHVSQLGPGEHVSWRYEADPSLAEVPVSAQESTRSAATCGSPGRVRVELELDFTDALDDVRLTKDLPSWLRVTSSSASCGSISAGGGLLNWTLGSVSPGDSCVATIEGMATLGGETPLPAASLYYERHRASVLERVLGLRAVGPAAAGVEKNRTRLGYYVRPSFENMASELDYELEVACVWEGSPPGEPGSRLVGCQSPGVSVSPGEVWVGSWIPDPGAPASPKYYASVNFTAMFDSSGSQIPLGRGGRVGADVLEPELNCSPPSPGPPRVSLRFSKEASPEVVGVGEELTFRISVKNSGETRVSGATVADRLPDELRYVQGSSKVNGTPGEPVTSDGVLNWVLPALDPGDEVEIEFRAEAVARPRGTDVIYNVVLYGGDEVARAAVRIVGGFPPAPAPSPASAPGPNVTAVPRLSLGKTCSVGELTLGGAVTFTITLTNQGNGSTGPMVVEDDVPAELAYVDGTAAPPAEYAAGALRWRVGPLDPGETFRASFQAVAVGGVGRELVNVVRAGNLSAECRLRVLPPPPNVSISKAGSYAGNGTISYVVTVYSDRRIGVALVDHMPGGVRVIPGSVTVSGADVRGGSASGGEVRVEADLREGRPMVVSYRAKVSAGLTGDVVNVAEIPPYGVRASSVVEIPKSPLAAASFEGPLAVPAAISLLLMERRRRRRGTLVDYGSLRLAALAGGSLEEIAGGRRVIISEATLAAAVSDPVVAPMVSELVGGGEVEVIPLRGGRLVEALALARATGVELETAASLLAAVEAGVRSATLSDARGAALAANLGLDLILVPLYPGGG